MNGRITIELGGVKTPLLFGMLAIEEFGKRRAKETASASEAKILYDLIYSGQYNHAVVNDLEPLSYMEVCEHVDDLIISNASCLKDVSDCFAQSKFIAKATGDVKKKEVEPVKLTKKPTGKK